MGVPSFYKWVKERYPLIAGRVHQTCSDSPDGQAGAGPVDNLYIDLNGIIHPCFHPEEGDPPTTEREVFERILAYIDALLWVVRPRRLLYLAVDGPAPRAKMNQQRGRRFKSAAEADQKKRVEARLREEWARQGRAPPPAAAAKAAGEDPLGDSNVITPGTQFMATLGRWLRHFCYARLNNPAGYDSPSLRIILSDASVPGEGEHKAMAYIRAQRHAKGYQPNLHHCIHGLDADLLMLALATHEARFSILREYQPDRREKKGGPPARRDGVPPACSAWGYEMCYIHVLRDYLQREFQHCNTGPVDWSKVRQGFVLDRAISDFIFLCFFVGNDFLPHLPALEIRDGALDALLDAYKSSISTRLGGYLTSGSEVALGRVEALLTQVAKLEQDIFANRREDEQRQRENRERQRRLDRPDEGRRDAYRGQAAVQRDSSLAALERDIDGGHGMGGGGHELMGRAGRVLASKGVGAEPVAAGSKRRRHEEEEEEEELDGGCISQEPSAQELARARAEAVSARLRGESHPFTKALDDAIKQADEEVAAEQEDPVRLGEPGWKDRYYQHKLGIAITDDQKRRDVAAEYVRGLCWVLRYYYGTSEGRALPHAGVPSWTWFYPYHYAPCASDLIGLARLEKHAKQLPMGEPFPPLMQLMAVLPSQSSHALPGPLRELMMDEGSPVADFYPRTFKQDLNGAHALWKAIPLLPFIEQERLRREIERAKPQLAEEARARNRFGLTYLYAQPEDPLARELWELAERNKHLDGFEIGRVTTEPRADPGLALIVSPYHSVPHGGTRSAPCAGLKAITHNRVASASVSLPQTRAHAASLLPGAAPPRSVLGERDWPRPSRDGQRLLGGGGGGDSSTWRRGHPNPHGQQVQQWS